MRNRQGESSRSDLASAVADADVVDDLLVVSDDHRLHPDVWTLDSACSHHYILNRSWFSTYTKTEEGSVTLGDDHPCKVEGIGNVQVRMFNRIVRTLTNVKHVPELKKNLMSLGYLEHSEFNFSSRDRSGVLNISNGAVVVMRGRRMDNNLYGMVNLVVMEESGTAAVAHDP